MAKGQVQKPQKKKPKQDKTLSKKGTSAYQQSK